MPLDPAIEAHYALGQEADRLFVDGRPRLELVRTLELLDRLLPPAPARVLDVGGGTGVYARRLVERGYDVALVDPVERHVAAAGPVVRAHIGDARDLRAFGTGYDAVLLLGPLYHLVDTAAARAVETEPTLVGASPHPPRRRHPVLAPPARFERATVGLEVRCSVQAELRGRCGR